MNDLPPAKYKYIGTGDFEDFVMYSDIPQENLTYGSIITVVYEPIHCMSLKKTNE